MKTVTSAEADLLDKLRKHAIGKPFRLNPDRDAVVRVVRGILRRLQTTGKATCPCRLATGDAEQDDRIICPCVYHEAEIAEHGMCHCQLFVAGNESGTGDGS